MMFNRLMCQVPNLGHKSPRECSGLGAEGLESCSVRKHLWVLLAGGEQEPRCAQVAKEADGTWPVPAMV